MAGYSSSRLSSRSAVFVACEGVWVPCTADLVSCKSEGGTLLLHGVNENRNDELVFDVFCNTHKAQVVCYTDFVKVKAGVSKSVTVITKKGQIQNLCKILV